MTTEALPTWKTTSETPVKVTCKREEKIDLTDAALLAATSGYCDGEWLCSLYIALPYQHGRDRTDGMRAELLRQALAEIDAARAVLVRLCDSRGDSPTTTNVSGAAP